MEEEAEDLEVDWKEAEAEGPVDLCFTRHLGEKTLGFEAEGEANETKLVLVAGLAKAVPPSRH